MREIVTEISINAAPETVWSHLVAFDSYPDWNPFITYAAGEVREGARLTVTIQQSGGKPMGFKPRVLIASPGKELRWLGQILLPGLFDGEHRFVLEHHEGGTKLTQAETFCGLLVPLMWKSMQPKTKRGFEMMNEALRQRCESGDS
ncbi:MAG: SRPBCC domain-containing protein [Planctomycetes bacterium]|nr:SRPBCC domain-containing protein [Planctomycetota bacterium]